MQQDQAPSAPVDPSRKPGRKGRGRIARLDRQPLRGHPWCQDAVGRRAPPAPGAGDVVEAYRG